MSATTGLSVVLFDLGGVLLKLREPRLTFGLAADDPDFHARWLASPSVRAYERGEMSATDFGERMARELLLPVDGAEFLRRFDNWIDGIYPGTNELLDRLPRRYQRAVLSNMNKLHWQYVAADAAFVERIDRFFLSYELGMTKPDPEIFKHVCASLQCTPAQVLFLDDNPANVRAGAAAGLHSVLARGLDEVEATLLEAGVLA